MFDGWVRMVALRYKLPIGQFDYMSDDEALFIQELAALVVQSSLELSRTLASPGPKENAAQHRTRLRKMSKSKSIIERLAHWYHTQSQLPREA
jgi:hypothetical protein